MKAVSTSVLLRQMHILDLKHTEVVIFNISITVPLLAAACAEVSNPANVIPIKASFILRSWSGVNASEAF